MFPRLSRGLFFFLIAFNSAGALATETEYLACKQTAYDNLMTRYQSVLPDQATSLTDAQGNRAAAEANKYESDYNRAQQACATRYPERNMTKYNACLKLRENGQKIDCEGQNPERNVALYNQCLNGAVDAGATRFTNNFAKDSSLASKPEVQALVAEYQADYTRAVTACANLRDSSPANQAISSCESSSSSANSSCSSSGSDEAMASVSSPGSTGDSIGSVCSQTAAKTSAAITSLSSVQTSCQSAVTSCQSACSQADSQVASLPAGQQSSFQSRIPAAKAQCQSAQSRLSAIQSALSQMRASQSNSAACTDDAMSNQALAETCNANPNLPQCQSARQNCSDPAYAAGNPICGNVRTPTLGDNSTGTGASTVASAPNSASSLGGGSEDALGSGGSSDLGSAAAPSGGGASSAFTNAFAAAKSLLANSGVAGLLPGTQGGGGALSGMKSANQLGAAGAAKGKQATDANAASGGRGGFRGFLKNGPGLTRANGSWIPPKVGDKKDGIENVNFDRFRPNMQGYRLPASDDPRAQILGANVDIWKQMSFQYRAQGPRLSP